MTTESKDTRRRNHYSSGFSATKNIIAYVVVFIIIVTLNLPFICKSLSVKFYAPSFYFLELQAKETSIYSDVDVLTNRIGIFTKMVVGQSPLVLSPEERFLLGNTTMENRLIALGTEGYILTQRATAFQTFVAAPQLLTESQLSQVLNEQGVTVQSLFVQDANYIQNIGVDLYLQNQTLYSKIELIEAQMLIFERVIKKDPTVIDVEMAQLVNTTMMTDFLPKALTYEQQGVSLQEELDKLNEDLDLLSYFVIGTGVFHIFVHSGVIAFAIWNRNQRVLKSRGVIGLSQFLGLGLLAMIVSIFFSLVSLNYFRDSIEFGTRSWKDLSCALFIIYSFFFMFTTSSLVQRMRLVYKAFDVKFDREVTTKLYFEYVPVFFFLFLCSCIPAINFYIVDDPSLRHLFWIWTVPVVTICLWLTFYTFKLRKAPKLFSTANINLFGIAFYCLGFFAIVSINSAYFPMGMIVIIGFHYLMQGTVVLLDIYNLSDLISIHYDEKTGRTTNGSSFLKSHRSKNQSSRDSSHEDVHHDQQHSSRLPRAFSAILNRSSHHGNQRGSFDKTKIYDGDSVIEECKQEAATKPSQNLDASETIVAMETSNTVLTVELVE